MMVRLFSFPGCIGSAVSRPAAMSPRHDDLFLEINSARKLAAEFALRPGGKAVAGGMQGADEAEMAALAEEEKRVAELARERWARKEKARAEAKAVEAEMEALRKSISSTNERRRLEAAMVLEELAKAREEERAAGDLVRETMPVPADALRSTWRPGAEGEQVWYFTSGGERRGPVTFADLRAMVAESALDPRLDMVWKKGMDEWRAAGRIDGLFERSAFPNMPELPVAMAPQAQVAPRSKLLANALASKDLLWPGIGRGGLWAGLVAVPLIWKTLLPWVLSQLPGSAGGGVVPLLVSWFWIVPWAVLAALLTARVANLGMKRSRAFLVLVPFLNLWLLFRCLFCPPGYAWHRKIDPAGIVMLAASGLAIPLAAWLVLSSPAVAVADALPAKVRHALERAVPGF